MFTLAKAGVLVYLRNLLTCLLGEDAPRLRSVQKTPRKVVRDLTPLRVSEMLLCPHFIFLPSTRAKALRPELKQARTTFLMA